MAATNRETTAPAETELVVYTVSIDVETGEMVARDPRGAELARTATDANENHAHLAAKAVETLVSWYN